MPATVTTAYTRKVAGVDLLAVRQAFELIGLRGLPTGDTLPVEWALLIWLWGLLQRMQMPEMAIAQLFRRFGPDILDYVRNDGGESPLTLQLLDGQYAGLLGWTTSLYDMTHLVDLEPDTQLPQATVAVGIALHNLLWKLQKNPA